MLFNGDVKSAASLVSLLRLRIWTVARLNCGPFAMFPIFQGEIKLPDLRPGRSLLQDQFVVVLNMHKPFATCRQASNNQSGETYCCYLLKFLWIDMQPFQSKFSFQNLDWKFVFQTCVLPFKHTRFVISWYVFRTNGLTGIQFTDVQCIHIHVACFLSG